MCPVAGCGSLLGISDLPGLDGSPDGSADAPNPDATGGASSGGSSSESSSGSSSGADASWDDADAGPAPEEASAYDASGSGASGSSGGSSSSGGGICTSGATQCTSDTQVETCNTSGQWGTAMACSSNQTCAGGVCSTPCLSWSLGGIGVPAGTVATASSTCTAPSSCSASSDSPSYAIDRNLSTNWNSGGNTASLSLQFPTPQAITGIRIAAGAYPGTNEAYAVMTLADADSGATTIGSATEMVNTGTATTEVLDAGTITIEPAIPVTPGTYAGITINVNGMASWVVIDDVSLLTAECP